MNPITAMKRNLLLLLVPALLSACGSGSPETASSSGKAPEGAYKEYLDLKDALVKSDVPKAQAEAAELKAILDTLSAADTLRLAVARASAAAIAASGDLPMQREAFSPLSESFLSLARDGTLGEYDMFVQHCPMAFSGKGGSWLSGQKEIRNPYYGDEMLECGEVKEEIKNK
jgi:hypothetical protein